jgi:lipoprotein-releasing system permease protein
VNVSSYIAKRYFFAKKPNNFIQVLSIVSIIGVAIGTMALIIVLSVFNGLEDVLRGVYGTFDPDLKIESLNSKTFGIDQAQLNGIKEIDGVEGLAPVVEENVVFSYRNTQNVVRLKGIGDDLLEFHKLDTFLLTGEVKFNEEDKEFAVLGVGVAYELGILVESDLIPIEAIFPKNVRAGAMPSANPLNRRRIYPSGIFQIEQNYDEKYVLSSLAFVQELTGYRNRYTSLEVYLSENAQMDKVKSKILDLMGDDFAALNSDEQHADLLRAVKIEKLFVYIALSFITAIASFNIFFCLSMLAIEKRKDMAVLISYGARPKMIRGIFLKQGAFIAMTGAVFGIGSGVAICWLQQKYGLIRMGMSTSLLNAYPVKLELSDILLVSLAMVVITIITSYRPSMIAARTDHKKYLG